MRFVKENVFLGYGLRIHPFHVIPSFGIDAHDITLVDE